MSIVVKNAHLDPNCEGCQAAERALEGYRSLSGEQQKKIFEMSERLEFLLWFYQYADFGPADSDVRHFLKERYKRDTGKQLPKGFEDA